MPSMQELLGENIQSGAVLQKSVQTTSMQELLEPKATDRFPTTPDAQKALTLEGELGIGKPKKSNIPRFDVAVPEGIDPTVMADEIVKSGLPPTVSPAAKSTITDPYDIISLMGKVVPTVAPVKAKAPYAEVPSFKQGEEDSWASKLVDHVSSFFTSKSQASAKAVYNLTLASELGVNPSAIDPDLVDAYRSGVGHSVTGLIRQVEGGMKYPKIDPRVMSELSTAQRLAIGAGGMAGDLPYMALGGLAGAGGGPLTSMAGAFALPEGLRAYYSYKLDKGEVDSPEKFIEALGKSVEATGKGLAVGAATGVAGKIAAPLGILPKLGAEATTMTGVSAGLEGRLPTPQDFFDSAMLIVGFHGLTNAGKVVKNVKDMWVKTGMEPKDIVREVQSDKELFDAVTKEDSIPEELLAKATAKIAEIEKIQMELAAKAEAAKNPVKAEELIAEKLKIEGEKIEEIRKGEVEPEIDSKLMELEGEEGIDISALEEAFPEGKVDALKINETKAEAEVKVEAKVEEPIIDEVVKPKRKVVRKKKEPVTELDEQLGTPGPELLQPSNPKHPFRDSNVEYTNTMSKMFKEKLQGAGRNIEVYTRYAINEVNRYLNGEDVNIEKVREVLSDLSSKAEDVRNQFDRTDDFIAWQRNVGEAAKWARGVEKVNKESPTFMMGVDPTQIKKVVKDVKDRLMKLYKPDQRLSTSGYIFDDGKNVNLTIKIPGGYKSTPHSDAIFEGLSMFDAEVVKNILDGGSEFNDQLSPYLKHSNSIRYTREGGNHLSIELGSRPTSKQISLIEDSLPPNGKISIDFPYDSINTKSITVDVADMKKSIDRYFNRIDAIDALKINGSKGTQLNMGIDPTQIPEATRKIIEGVKEGFDYVKRSREMKSFKPAEAAKLLREGFVHNFIDRSGNIRQALLKNLGDEGYRIIQKMYLSKGASSIAAQQLKQMGKEVYNSMPKGDRDIFDTLVLSVRMIDIGKYKLPKDFAFPKGFTPAESAARLELFTLKDYNKVRNLTEKEGWDLYHTLDDGSVGGKVGAYFNWMKKPLKDMLDGGLISKKEYGDLVSHNYRRLKLVDVYDQKSKPNIGGQKRTVHDSGVQALSHGRETDIYEASSEVMALEVFNRAYGRILNNEANKGLYELALRDKENPFARTKDNPKDRIPSGWSPFFVYKDGVRKAIYLSPEMAKEWITNSPEMSYKLSKGIQFISGSNLLRTFATGINWGFALANLPRDIMHSWFAARTFQDGKWTPVYSSNAPVFAYQYGRNFGRVFSDAILRKGRYQDYIREGGGMEFLVHQGRLLQRGRHIDSEFSKFLDVMGWPGETSEIIGRLNIREQVIINKTKEKNTTFEETYKDKYITQEATFSARDFMDFGQGGGITKALDNGIPYLNAGIQGMRGFWRGLKENPYRTIYKLSQFAAIVTGLYIYNQKQNPETMKNLHGNIDMQNNLVIPMGDGFSYLDEKGQTKYPYYKIPLDNTMRFFKMFFEASTDKWLGNPVDAKAVANSLANMSPVGMSSMPPTISGAIGYFFNVDTWKVDDVWKGTPKPIGYQLPKWATGNQVGGSEEEYNLYTPQAMKDLGALTGTSPERDKYVIEQLVTGGSEFAWISGYGYDKIFGDLDKSQRQQFLAETLAKSPIAKRFIGVTNPYSQFAGKIDKAIEDSSVRRLVENGGLDKLVDGYLYRKTVKEEEIDAYIAKSKDKDTADRLKSDYKFQVITKDLPMKSLWMSLKRITDTEARARVFVEEYDKATIKEKAQLDEGEKIIKKAGGVISDEFKKEVGRLRPINN